MTGSWLRVGEMWRKRPFIGLSFSARGLLLTMVSWAADNGVKGHVTVGAMWHFDASLADVHELEKAGFITHEGDEVEDGWYAVYVLPMLTVDSHLVTLI